MSDKQTTIADGLAGSPLDPDMSARTDAPTSAQASVSASVSEISARFQSMRGAEVRRRAESDYAMRREVLKSLSGAIRRHEAAIIKALAADLGKPEPEVRLTEILPVQAEISHTLKHLKRWMRSRRVGSTLLTFGTSASIRPEPKGTVLIIAPWNYPFGLLMGPLTAALAAGNATILKPSELAPATSALVAKIVAETFAPDLVWVAEGGLEVAQALLEQPFDHLFFTGSPKVGRKVMAQAARHLTPVTLELGGKSPVIVGPGANLKSAAKAVAWGKYSNAGQTCIAPDHIYVAESQMEAFLAELKASIRQMYGSTPERQASGRDYARIVSDRHFKRLAAMIADAETHGATIVEGGTRDAASRFVAPTVMRGVQRDSALMREEIFGPVLPVLPFADISEVIAQINDGPKPLALYIFETDKEIIETVMCRTSSGAVGVNVTLAHYMHLNLPFGGIGNSGMGAAHGEWGFRAFSHDKPVLQNRFAPLSGFMPPYSGPKRRSIKLMARLLGR